MYKGKKNKMNPVLVLEFAGKDKDKGKDSDDNMEMDEEMEEALMIAAKQIRSAKSDEDFSKALKAFIEICTMSEY